MRSWRILQQIENPQTIPGGELQMIRLLDDGLGGKQGVTKDKIRQVRMAQRNRAQEQRFFLGANPQGHPAIVLNRYSRHAYTFK
jgi:hypothetical protein